MRKEITVTLMDGGQEKKFKVTQMPATQAERVLFKLGLLLGGDFDVDELRRANDPAHLMGVLLGAVANKPYERIQELLDELISTVAIVHGGVVTDITPNNIDSFIEEMGTLMKLRGEVIKINNFFPQSGQSVSGESPAPTNITIKKKN